MVAAVVVGAVMGVVVGVVVDVAPLWPGCLGKEGTMLSGVWLRCTAQPTRAPITPMSEW